MADLEAGRVLGDRFEVVGVLGHGGMATVYLAQDRVRGEAVALKVLHGHLASSAAWRSRLRREVNAASRLRHPNALVASDLHDLDGTLAVSMPLHPGRTLAEYVEREGPLTAAALERIARQLASALREAHGAGLVHRDVTPTNVLVDDGGDAVLTDFGLARFTDQRTATGTGVLGTAGYAAPEVYKGVRGDPRSDLYGLGAVLYQAATGAAPFAAPDPVGVLQKQLGDERVALRQARPDLPPHLAALVDRLLAVEAEGRPQGAAEVLDVLDRRVVAPAPVPVAKEPARAHHIPPGGFTVVVRERRRDRMRRNQVRVWMERQRRADLGADIERAMGEVKRRVMGMMEIESTPSPEEGLANAVAREAHLPPGALVVPHGLVERRFRLVEDVDEAVASRLARAARDEGFDARPQRLGAENPAEQFADVARTGLRMGFLFVALVIGMVVAFGVNLMGTASQGFPWDWPWQAFPLVFFFLMIPTFSRRRIETTRAEDLPVAFGADLRFHLAPGANVTLPPPPSFEPVATTTPAPKPVAAPTSRHGAVIERTRAQLAAFEHSLGDSADRLPEAAMRDLKGTLRDLRERVEALGRRVLALETEITALDDIAAAAAVDRIEARLERLRTLSRAGRAEEAAEIPKLETALAAHRRVLDQVESLEGQITLAVARLLETGAAAAHARIELIEAPEPALSADDLLARLRRQTDDTRKALDELEPAPRLPRDPLPSAPRPDRPKIADPA